MRKFQSRSAASIRVRETWSLFAKEYFEQALLDDFLFSKDTQILDVLATPLRGNATTIYPFCASRRERTLTRFHNILHLTSQWSDRSFRACMLFIIMWNKWRRCLYFWLTFRERTVRRTYRTQNRFFNFLATDSSGWLISKIVRDPSSVRFRFSRPSGIVLRSFTSLNSRCFPHHYLIAHSPTLQLWSTLLMRGFSWMVDYLTEESNFRRGGS